VTHEGYEDRDESTIVLKDDCPHWRRLALAPSQGRGCEAPQGPKDPQG